MSEKSKCVWCGSDAHTSLQCKSGMKPSSLAPASGSAARIETCPQCGADVIQTNLGGGKTDDYCEECGWPDENRGAQPATPNDKLSNPARTKNHE